MPGLAGGQGYFWLPDDELKLLDSSCDHHRAPARSARSRRPPTSLVLEVAFETHNCSTAMVGVAMRLRIGHVAWDKLRLAGADELSTLEAMLAKAEA